MYNKLTSILLVCVSIAACGGGGGGGGTPASPPPPLTFAVGGTVSGLSGAGLVLQNNAAGNLTINADGAFTFAGALTSGSAYNVTIATQPTANPAQICMVANGTGTISNAAVSNVAVSCRALTGKFVYVPNILSNDVSGYAIDRNTGALTELAGSPFPVNGDPPRALGFDPTERFMYAFGSVTFPGGPATIAGYAIDGTTGALTPIAGMAVINLPASTSSPVTFHPNGRLLYVPVGDNSTPSPNNGLYAYRIDATTGALTPVPASPYTFNGMGLPRTPKLSANGQVMYVPNAAGSPNNYAEIGVYAVDTTTGVLTPQSSATIVPSVNEVVLNPSGTHLHTRTSDISNPDNRIFAIDAVSGDLSGPTSGPSGWGQGILFSRTGNFVYYPTRVATPSPMPPGPATFGPSSVSVYSVNGATLTELDGSPHPTSQGAAFGDVIDPTGNYLVTSDIEHNQIFAFKIDSATGALTAVPGSPFTPAVGTNIPSNVAFDPSGRFAYLADVGGAQNPSTNTISAYSIDAATGVPTFIASYPTGNNPSFFPRIIGRQ